MGGGFEKLPFGFSHGETLSGGLQIKSDKSIDPVKQQHHYSDGASTFSFGTTIMMSNVTHFDDALLFIKTESYLLRGKSREAQEEDHVKLMFCPQTEHQEITDVKIP